MMPAGYFGASGVNEYSVWATMLYHRYQRRAEDFGDRAMPYGRWEGLDGWQHRCHITSTRTSAALSGRSALF